MAPRTVCAAAHRESNATARSAGGCRQLHAKCTYLAAVLARELGLRRFDSETHVMVGLWSAEVIHAVRLRPASIRALARNDESALLSWLRGTPPTTGVTRSFVLLDPFARGRKRAFIGLDGVLAGARPRIRDYREAAERLQHQSTNAGGRFWRHSQ